MIGLSGLKAGSTARDSRFAGDRAVRVGLTKGDSAAVQLPTASRRN